MKLGVDLYSLRSQGWTPFECLDYCAAQRVQVVHFSEIKFLGSLEPDHLLRLRSHAERLGLEIEIGMLSICPSSRLYRPEERLTDMITAAQIIGSKIVRCVVGNSFDRPMQPHIDNALAELRKVRSQALDANVMIAVENHSGDMQAHELKALVEAAGTDFVGVCLDSGNPLYAFEDPHFTLDTLAPYVLTSHVRDTAIWTTPQGIAVAWCPMGEGNVDIGGYVRKYLTLCPGRALSLEIIVRAEPRYFAYADANPHFLALAESGTPKPNRTLLGPAQELEFLESSLRFTRRETGVP